MTSGGETGEETARGSEASRNREVRRFALWTIVVSVVVMAIKFAAYILSGSIALYSDALESIVNVIAAFAAFTAIRFAQKPPDENHPFGHHKAEYLSAVLEGILILGAALLIINEAVRALFTMPVLQDTGLGMIVNIVATALNGAWAIVLMRIGRQARSPALQADAAHLLTDVWTSLGVVAGLMLVVATGWAPLDPLIAILVALNILFQGWKVVTGSVGGLMDIAVDPEDQAKIESVIVANAAGAIEVHDIRTRKAGSVHFVDCHLVVDGMMSVAESHAICDRIEHAMRRHVPGTAVTIHVEPEVKAKQEGLVFEALHPGP